MRKCISFFINRSFYSYFVSICLIREILGDEVTILHDNDISLEDLKTVQGMTTFQSGGKEGSQWKCYNADNFYGWEADNIVAVSTGSSILEMITRARNRLCVVMVDSKLESRGLGYNEVYTRGFQKAVQEGLVQPINLESNV